MGKNNSEYRFNIEVYKSGGNKEFKIVNAPIDKLEEIYDAIKEKYT